MALCLDAPQRCRVGALGTYDLSPGHYIYVGSAWGPSGLAARVNRHLTGRGKTHWHIDYLRQLAYPTAFWLAPGAHIECAWADVLGSHPQAQIPIPGFGSSDCRCPTHLFYFADTPLDQIPLPDSSAFVTSQDDLREQLRKHDTP